jgi:urease accessory protein UreE
VLTPAAAQTPAQAETARLVEQARAHFEAGNQHYAAGRGDSEHAVPLDRIQAVLDEAMGRVRRVIAKLCEQQK